MSAVHDSNFFAAPNAAKPTGVGLDLCSGNKAIESVLRDAAFVSSTGRVYRLFNDHEESVLGETFSLTGTRNTPSETENCSNDYLKSKSIKQGDVLSSRAHFVTLTQKEDDRAAIVLFSNVPKESSSHDPEAIDETFKRLRAVEGVCGRHQTTRTTRLFNSLVDKLSKQDDPSAKNQRLVMFPKTPTIPLNEAVSTKMSSSLSSSSTVSKPALKSPSLDFPDLLRVADFRTELFETPRKTLFPNEEKISGKGAREEEVSEGDVCKEKVREEENSLSTPNSEPLQTSEPSIRLLRLDVPATRRNRLKERLFEKKKRSFSKVSNRKSTRPAILKTDETDRETPESGEEATIVQEILQDVSKRIGEAKSYEKPASEICVSVCSAIETAGSETETESAPIVLPHFIRNTVEHSTFIGSISTWKPSWPSHIDSLKQAAVDQIRFLCDHLDRRIKEGRKTISFNSFFSGEGCTTLSLCAARELTARGHRVLLADSHIQDPALARLLDVHADPDMYEIVSLEDRLDFLPWSGTPVEIDLQGQIEACCFEQLVAFVRNDYDIVILDNGSMTEGCFERRIASWKTMGSDGVLLIVDKKNSGRIDFQAISARLKRHDVALLGIIENYVR